MTLSSQYLDFSRFNQNLVLLNPRLLNLNFNLSANVIDKVIFNNPVLSLIGVSLGSFDLNSQIKPPLSISIRNKQEENQINNNNTSITVKYFGGDTFQSHKTNNTFAD